MKEAYSILPVYSGDVSGACSALFELGGMVVIHDPSGCNSTYNTHDELRWYDQDSLIFLSGLTEMDAILGDDEKLIREVEAAAYQLKPKFIALTNSPIPYMNGTDLEAIAIQIEEETEIPTFYIPTNGMHDYVNGAGYALERIVEKFVIPDYERAKEQGQAVAKAGDSDADSGRTAGSGAGLDQTDASAASRTRVNLLGVTPLDFGRSGMVSQLKEAVAENGYELLSCFAMGDSLETLTQSWKADKNIVVSAVGMKAALKMEEYCGVPWELGEELLAGLPMTENLLNELRNTLTAPRRDVFLIGEPVTMQALAAAIYRTYGNHCFVISTIEALPQALLPKTRAALSEEEVQDALTEAEGQIVIADPLYRYIVPRDAKLCELPHLAFSGRIYFGLEQYKP